LIVKLFWSDRSIVLEAEEDTDGLILWRHAGAEEGVPDAARKLNEKGEKTGREMAVVVANTHPLTALRIL